MTTQNHTTVIPFATNRNPEDPNPTTPAAVLALPAPSQEALRAARRARHVLRERKMRRSRVAARAAGIVLAHRGSILALPAWVGLPAAWEKGPRERTATIRMQEYIIAASGIDTGNPNDSHAKLMDEYLAKKAAQQAEAVAA